MSEDLFREAGALGVYSLYYQSNRDDFKRVKQRSPMRSPHRRTFRAYNSDYETNSNLTTSTRSETPLSAAIPPPETPTPAPQAPQAKVVISGMKYLPDHLEVLEKVVRSLPGKDKLAKILYYVLRLLIVGSLRVRSTEKYADSHLEEIDFTRSKNNVISRLVSNPRLLQIFLLQQVQDRSRPSVAALGLFRQMIRFGTLPFMVRKFGLSLRQSICIAFNDKLSQQQKLQSLYDYWYNWKMFSQCVGLYYTIWDQMGMLFKLNVLQRDEMPKIYSICDRESFNGWYYTILIGLKDNYVKYRDTSAQINATKVNFRVKERASVLVAGTTQPSEAADAYREELEALYKTKRTAVIDILRLLCDLVYDTPFVFHKKFPEPLLLSFGIGSGLLGFYNVYNAEYDRMVADAN